ncbi:proprotein convertase P-domain-containing protein [Pseudomarimonas arenosa]|uniref:Proprotein convertase P-domain-containing protein n=1 Tax=Pseudomarimonas arenosa TaxID=2774145 RepID=A0AAW3ZLY2_9GAMM|nr:proprotein convertase P-domain-containing protein [Pseudomarimonas arenosa]MBD8526179.1 proprotein convertase P-domain-containing protein [Pseudomarimonas arenosa]
MRVVVAPLAAAMLLSFSVDVAAAKVDTKFGDFNLGGTTVLPAPDLAKLSMEDSKQTGGPYRYGVLIDTQGMRLGAKGFGTWERVSRGQWRWSWDVMSPEAKSLDFHFSKIKLPASAQLLIRGQGEGNERLIDASKLSGNEFWSPYVLGERARLEITVDAREKSQLELEIGSVTHGYRGLFEGGDSLQKSGSCNVDTACSAGDAWRDQIDSVGHYTFNQGSSAYVCTGTLIGNTSGSTTPYFLTANHCMSTQTVVSTIVVYWNYQSSTCRTPGSSSSGTPLSRSIATHSQSGATLRATNSASDFSLIELSQAVPSGANPYWSGWDATGSTPSSAVGIHHPAGHEKRIAVEDQALSVSGYGGGSGSTHWRVMDWDQGTTEGGSSGSGLWNQNKLLVGQLHGGSAACGNNLSDYYGRLSVSWNGGGSSSSRLSNWLDPGSTGATSFPGYRAGSNPGDTTAPSVPGSLNANGSSSSVVGLSWSASSDTGGSGLAGYKIERCTGASCSNFSQVGTAASTSYNDTGLSASTTYRYRVRAYDGAGNNSGYSSIASATTQAGTQPGNMLYDGVPVTGLSGATGSQLQYVMNVPAGATNLVFNTSGSSGDADLYVKFGSQPTTSSYDCRSWSSSSNESCSFSTAQAGTYYVMVNAYSSYSGLSLVGNYDVDTTPPGGSYFENTTNVSIPDNNSTGVYSNISVSGRSGNAPSDLEVSVDIVHTYIGDLIVDLVAPDGSVYNLHNRSGGSADNISQTYTVNASSEAANGTWRLRVRDRARRDTGYIDGWSLQF